MIEKVFNGKITTILKLDVTFVIRVSDQKVTLNPLFFALSKRDLETTLQVGIVNLNDCSSRATSPSLSSELSCASAISSSISRSATPSSYS